MTACANHFNHLLSHRTASTEVATESNTAAYLKTKSFIITLFFASLSDSALVQHTVSVSYSNHCYLYFLLPDKWFWLKKMQRLPSLGSTSPHHINESRNCPLSPCSKRSIVLHAHRKDFFFHCLSRLGKK